MFRRTFYAVSLAILVVIGLLAVRWPAVLWSLVVVGPLVALGLYDSFQRRHAVLRNWPIVGRFRYGFETLRPEIQQYFIESNVDAFPIEREMRSVAYQRAKGDLDTKPFGTQRDVYRVGYEWASHSIAALGASEIEPRVAIGGTACRQPYSASILNVSAMSFGALSSAAVRALSAGAKRGNFALNTGEGGVSPHHKEGGADLIWQVGTGYFGCRDASGRFDPERFRDQAALPNIKMIELKLSQGAKPGHGGILPGVKVTAEVAAIRGVPVGETVMSPPSHSAFSSPRGLVEFLAELRALSGGKPVGFKLCVGRRSDFLSICKAMLETRIYPDFVSVDGGEGGTGAAPLEFSNSLGMPARDAWIFVHNALVGVGLRDAVRVVASGKIFTGFHMARAIAIGADCCASARGMMLALGCIQALRCNTDHCPTGVATQRRALVRGLDVVDKSERVFRYQAGTLHGFLEIIGAMGLREVDDLRPHMIFRRVDDLRVRHFGELYDYLEAGQLLGGDALPEEFREPWADADADTWGQGPEPGRHSVAL